MWKVTQKMSRNKKHKSIYDNGIVKYYSKCGLGIQPDNTAILNRPCVSKLPQLLSGACKKDKITYSYDNSIELSYFS